MTETTWVNIDLDTLGADVRQAYEAYKVAQRQAAALRQAFEDMARATTPVAQGKRIVFGYKFGKLSAALVEDDAKPGKAKQPTASLADFLAAQAAAGRRA